ncbi:MAG: hypothetical protein KAI44_10190, partial [Methylococcales bacterium]|nr:hypothetical protein [Methylococcales bacterium]
RDKKRHEGGLFNGGKGNDTITGGYYGDTYQFNLGDGQDTITDSGSLYSSYRDILRFGAGFSANNLWLTQDGNDLLLQHVGSDDQIRITKWFTSSNWQIEQIQVENAVLYSNQVANLVNAMSAFDVQEQLAPVIAVSWG